MILSEIPDLPAGLGERFQQVASQLADLDIDCPPALTESAARVLVSSQFVLETLLRQPDALIERMQDAAPVSRELLASRLDLAAASESEAMAALRRRRNVELAAIAWRDIAGLATLDQTLTDLSELADALTAIALDKAAQLLEPRFGRPTRLLVLGMGKLGGHELNFSSDIDLVLLFPDPEEGADVDEIAEYSRRLALKLIHLLDARTAEGIVYRVDTRLRPFGQSGPLALSIGALEAYLVQHGRDWERYAYVKARLLTGQKFESEVFAQVLRPFVYRRYLDFGMFDALRQMKRLISEDVARKDKHDNIKLGRGGIREIEFIAQLFQLVRGGQDPELRERSLQPVLAALADLEIVERDTTDKLTMAYRYLRVAENRLQELDDRQTHEIPKDDEHRLRWALAMGATSWDAFAAELEQQRDMVQQAFDDFGWEADEGAGDLAAESSLADVFDAGRLAETAGELLEPLDELHASGLYRRMDETSRLRLRAFVAELVPALEGLEQPGKALERVMPIIRAVCRRSAYLSLLLENPSALERLLNLAEHSSMLARLIAEHPLLLDELLDPRLFDSPPSRAELEIALRRQISGSDPDDTEAQLNAMRDFQRAAIFRIAVADRFGDLPLMQVSDRLTDAAELVIAFARELAGRELETRHGKPMHGAAGALHESDLVVVAYGKLGGLELGYGSDLDLVFLHNSEGEVQETTGPAVIDNQRYFARLVQRMIHFLSVQTSSGKLYEIDTRLRPDGASGLLVTGLASFERYQREEAWTWEHQALLRSRSVAGPVSMRDRFEQIRIAVLTEAVKRETLKEEVAKMRARMREELSAGTSERFDLKQDPGGLADIEFLIDYLVLARADQHAALVEYPDNVRQLEALEAAGLLAAPICADLKQGYLELRARTHVLALADGGKLVPIDEFTELRQRIVALWQDTFGDTPG